ncbi:LacI family DNA-binding transcriptional regulator, partial [Varibaculum cambriense]
MAKEAGVSIATVSRALNGNTHLAGATRQKVLAAADKLGYQ